MTPCFGSIVRIFHLKSIQEFSSICHEDGTGWCIHISYRNEELIGNNVTMSVEVTADPGTHLFHRICERDEAILFLFSTDMHV